MINLVESPTPFVVKMFTKQLQGGIFLFRGLDFLCEPHKRIYRDWTQRIFQGHGQHYLPRPRLEDELSKFLKLNEIYVQLS